MIRTLVLPAYNEQKHIADIVTRGAKFVDRVIVIDNCSTDDTLQEARRAGAIALHHCVNLGKSGSLKTGCEMALRLGTDVIAFMDSDGQHEPEDLPRFFKALEDERLDIVIGRRAGLGKMPPIRKLGNTMIAMATRLLFKIDVKDVQSGFRVFRADIYDKIKWNSTGSAHYFADAEITARVGDAGLAYKELEVETIYHDKYKGMNALQGLNLLWRVFFWRLVF
jgi:glycosyltransferase involved in cell wall biosynthesis